MTVTIRYAGTTMTKEIPNGSNVGCLRTNRDYAAVFGFNPTNVDFVVNGSRAADTTVLSNGDNVVVQPKAHEKASR